MKQLESVSHTEEDPYGEINYLEDLIRRSGNKRELKLEQSTSSSEYSPSPDLKHQIERIKVLQLPPSIYSVWSAVQ